MTASIIGPVAIRREVLEKICQESVGHTHNYDHTTIVIRGRLKIIYHEGVPMTLEEREAWVAERRAEGTTDVLDIPTHKWVEKDRKEYSAGAAVFIAADIRHTLKALDENTQYMCVFSHRDFDGLVTQDYVGNAKAYD